MLRCFGRSRRGWAGRWTAVLAIALAMVQLVGGPPTSSRQGLWFPGLLLGAARGAQVPTGTPEDEASASSNLEESVVVRGRSPRVARSRDDRHVDSRHPDPHRANPGGGDRPGAPGGPFGRRSAGGRAVRLMFQSHRC